MAEWPIFSVLPGHSGDRGTAKGLIAVWGFGGASLSRLHKKSLVLREPVSEVCLHILCTPAVNHRTELNAVNFQGNLIGHKFHKTR